MDVDVTVQGVQSACPSADDRRRPLYQVEQAHLPERVPHMVESNGFSLHALFLLPQIGLLFLLSLIIVLFGIGLGIVLQALVEAFIDEVYPVSPLPLLENDLIGGCLLFDHHANQLVHFLL